jgi:hypothetical protein
MYKQIYFFKKFILAILFLFCVAGLFAVPPFIWYSTYSVENYGATGHYWGQFYFGNLGTCHEDATGFHNAVAGHHVSGVSYSYRYNRRNTACTAARWTGASAEVNYNDFVFYAGHGWGRGPVFGGNSAYRIICWDDIRFGQYGYLKWVQAAACEWFVDGSKTAGFGLSPFSRWDPCFKGVHVVQGHRAVTYDHEYSNQMSDEFWDRWVDSGNSIYYSWRQAQIHWVYQEGPAPGLQPASMAHNSTYLNETWSAAGNAKAPDGAGILKWASVGNPVY